MMVYAYVCTLCNHLSSMHRLAPDAPSVQGPYRCKHTTCGCEITQGGPTRTIDRATFDAEFADDMKNYESLYQTAPPDENKGTDVPPLSQTIREYIPRCPNATARDLLTLAAGELEEHDEITDDYARILDRQSDLLTAAVNVFRGDPPELTTWSHHDVADLAREAQRWAAWFAGLYHATSDAINWDTTCLNCSNMLTQVYAAERERDTLAHALEQILHAELGDMDETDTVERITKAGIEGFNDAYGWPRPAPSVTVLRDAAEINALPIGTVIRATAPFASASSPLVGEVSSGFLGKGKQLRWVGLTTATALPIDPLSGGEYIEVLLRPAEEETDG